MTQLLTDAKRDNHEVPYVFDYYNVKPFTTHPDKVEKSEVPTPARIVNSLVKALNESPKIPRFIVVVPDWDILKYINHFTYGVEKLSRRNLRWMINNMIRAVDDRKEKLHKILPGSIVHSEPRFIWVKMLQRMKSYEKILTVRGKYNSTLELALANERFHYIIDPNPILRDPDYFDRDNNLNSEGCLLFWKEIDECIKLYDDHKLALRPRKDLEKDPKTDSAVQLRFKLPPPPRHQQHVTEKRRNSKKQDKSHLFQSSFHQEQRNPNNRGNGQTTRSDGHNRQPNKIWVNKNFFKDY